MHFSLRYETIFLTVRRSSTKDSLRMSSTLIAFINGFEPTNGAPVPEYPVPPVYEPSFFDSFWFLVVGWGSWLYIPFLLWMVFYSLKYDPDRYVWLFVMLVLQPVGAILYFIVRWLPSSNVQLPSFTHRWTKSRELRQLETAALQIGNAHQFIQYGEALRKVGMTEKANEAFQGALKKDGNNLAALWGAASMEFQLGKFADAKEKLQKVLEADPTYKFGDVSLLYGKSLLALNENEAARIQLEKHIQKWRHPEAMFLLAKLCQQAGDKDEARTHLRGMIVDIDSSPKAIARKNLFWRSRAKKALRNL